MIESIHAHETEHSHELYEPRSGERIEDFVAVLNSEPEHPLSERDKQRAREWNDALAIGHCEVDGEVLTISGHPDREPEYASLGEALKANSYLSKRHEVNLDYFQLHFSAKDARRILTTAGITPHEGVLTKAQLREAFLEHALNSDTQLVKKLADQSKKSEDLRMAHELAGGKVPTPPERIRVFSDGTALMEKLRVLNYYKEYYGRVSKALKASNDTSELHTAKQMYVDLYSKTVNAQLAETYPDVLAFWYQAKHMSEPKRSILTDAIEESVPMVKHLRADFLRHRARQLFVRLDRLRNGASREHHGPYVSISPELVEYLEHQHDIAEEPLKARLSSTEIARFDTEKFDADEMKQLAEYVLTDLNLLSSETEYVPKDKNTRAADGKWQVQIREDIDAMGAEDPPGVFEIPANFNRTLTKGTAPVGVIPGLVHEFTHIIQHENKRKQGGQGIGSAIKGKNQTVYFEAGGIRNEDRVQKDLFGRNRTQAPHYMRAMMVLEAGGTEGEALKAFYDSYRADNPHETELAAGKAAVSRVMRLARLRGGYNSQPLNYAETGLIIHKTEHLKEHVKGLLFDYGAFNIGDLARLHEYDLLPQRIQHFPYEKVVDASLRFIRQKLAERDSSSKKQ
jgi:hypothetical protein